MKLVVEDGGGWPQREYQLQLEICGNMAVGLSFQSTAFTFSNLVLRAQRPSVPHVRAAAGTEGLPGG